MVWADVVQRKNGLFKKAYELGVLCSVDVAVIIFGHNNKVYEYCSTDSDAMVQRRLHYTGERDIKTPADFGGDKGNNDDDDDCSDDGAGTSRNAKFVTKKRSRDDEHDYDTLLQPQPQPPSRPLPSALPNLSSLARGPIPPVGLPIPPYHPHPSLAQPPQHAAADALMEREREREREREGALRQLGLQHLLSTAAPPSHTQPPQFAPHSSHPSLVPNINLAALLQANPLLGLGVPGLNLGIGGFLGGSAPGAPPAQQDILAMLSANAANVGQGSALYSNPLFSTLFPNHPGLGGTGDPVSTSEPAHKPPSAPDLWPSLARAAEGSAVNVAAAAAAAAASSAAGDTWLSFLGNPRTTSQPPTDDVDLSSLFPFDAGPSANGDDTGGDERDGKRAKR
ncbi:Transcription factor RLM1 [Ceratobasidium theobromae]|uniref:Transcription factor RLM1 n=1 Tax=Ceratobasidium theobromae TaxID=1582974 RepID=A0A5N5QB28_9AGAM|nr:Transcription factor RLM1 [Ceratobasidium theobromae]